MHYSGYTPYTTIKDFEKSKLEKRVNEMTKRGFELIGMAERSEINGLVYYAKLKYAGHPNYVN